MDTGGESKFDMYLHCVFWQHEVYSMLECDVNSRWKEYICAVGLRKSPMAFQLSKLLEPAGDLSHPNANPDIGDCIDPEGYYWRQLLRSSLKHQSK